jgi:GNAT superfamily N-acetyltransferase
MTTAIEPPEDLLALKVRVLGHLRETVRALADEVVPVEGGWVARTRSHPGSFSYNQVHISGPATAGEAIALANEHQADLPFLHLTVEDEPSGQALEAELAAAGWKVDREVFMALLEPSSFEVTGSGAIVELGEDEMLALVRRWLTEDDPNVPGARLDDVADLCRREGRLWHERTFGVRDRHGASAALTKLRADRATAWLEDVYTVPEERRQGHARLLVGHASELARAAGNDLTFILADDNDWPKHLYAEAGFRPVGRGWILHREK